MGIACKFRTRVLTSPKGGLYASFIGFINLSKGLCKLEGKAEKRYVEKVFWHWLKVFNQDILFVVHMALLLCLLFVLPSWNANGSFGPYLIHF